MPENRTGLGPQSPEWCEGKVNLPGIRTDVYVIPRRDIAKWPVLPETYTMGMGELAVYTGDFELAVNKKWRKLSVMAEKSPVTSESQGSKPSETTSVKAIFVHSVTGRRSLRYRHLPRFIAALWKRTGEKSTGRPSRQNRLNKTAFPSLL
jgi:hypothetical protein